MEFRVELLGGLRVTVNDRAIAPAAWTRRHPRALLALLALTAGHRLHREQLADALWPDLDPDSAAANLRKALHHARRNLSEDPELAATLIGGEGEALSLHRDAWVDVGAFEAAAAKARRAANPAAYEEALSLYGGDLLPEDRYEEWAVSRGEELRSDFLALLSEQAGSLEARGELDAAAAVLRRAVSEEPLDEDLVVRLMRVSALAGRRREALDTYDRLAERLDKESETEPAAETQQMREEIASRGGLSPELTKELWERVGDLRMLSGDVTGAATAFESAISMAHPSDPAAAALHRKAAEAYLGAHDIESADPHLSSAAKLDDPAEKSRVAAVGANAAWEKGDLSAAQELATKALSLAETTGEGTDLAQAHETLAIVCHFQGAWREGLSEEVERLGRLPDGDEQLAGVFDIHHCIGQYHLYGDGLWEHVEDYARETLDRADQLGAVRAQAFAWCLLGESLLLQARFDEAAGCLERSGELHATLGERSGALPWQRLAELFVSRGSPGEAAAPLRRASAIATISPMAPHMWGRIYATSAFGALEKGDPAEAIRSVRAAAAAAVRYGNCPTCSALLNPVAAEAFAAIGDAEGAGPFAEDAARVAEMFDSSAWRAMALSAEANLKASEGDSSGSAGLFREAAGRYEQAGQPYWAERTRARVDAPAGNAGGTAPS
ncbi:MAG: BTAD domain-containing putative transcriptional regulator [Actinomycetota bacterium]